MSSAAIVHPDFKEVIPLAPEFIAKHDGQTKNDCECNAAKRFFEKLRKDHPHLPIIITENALSSNALHIREAAKYNLHYILGRGPFLSFNQVRTAQDAGKTTELEIIDEKV